MNQYKEITTDEVFQLHKKTGSIHLIDVREADEFAEVSSPISRNLPLSQMHELQTIASLGIDKNEAIYLICRSGKRSARACEIFAELGYQRLFNVTGGMLAWQAAMLPIK